MMNEVEQKVVAHEHSWRDAWLKNSSGTRHVTYCVVCNEMKKDND